MLHPPFVLWPHSSSNARGQDCSWFQYQQCCNCQEAANSGAGGVETVAAVAGEATGVCTTLMRDSELRMYAGVTEVGLKSSVVELPPTATTEALVVSADSLILSTVTTSTSSTMLTVQIPQSSPLSRTSPPPLLSPPFSGSSTTMSLSSSLASSSEATKDLPAPTAVTMTIASVAAAAAKVSTTAATNSSAVAVSKLHQSSSRPASTQNPVSSSSVAPLLTTTMMMMMSSPLSSASSLRKSTSSVHNWFQSELDMRGIESVYSRYIISLLLQRDKDSHEDGGSGGPIEGITTIMSHPRREPIVATSNQSQTTTKVTPDEPKGISCVNNTKASLSANAGLFVAGTTTQGRRQKGVSKREKLPLSEEESKKREAVQCLLEVCDDMQAGGIEKLIEELMLKLKELEKKESTHREAVPVSVAINDNSKYAKQDPAERYYAAFPALSTHSSQTTPTIGSPSTVIPGSDNSNVWKKKLQQQQEQQQQQLQHQKQQQLMQRKRQLHQVKADKKLHYQSVSSNNCSGTPAPSISSCTKENKFQTKSRRNGNIRRRNDSTIRLGTQKSHTHHGNKENVHKRTESNSLTTRYSSARNRQHNSSFYPLHMVPMKQPQQRTASGKSKMCRTITCDMPAEMQHLASHTVTRPQQQPGSGNENTRQGHYYHRKTVNYNSSDYKSSICSDREGQKYCVIVENILKDILLSSNEKHPTMAADRDPYSTSHASHWLMQDRQYQHTPDTLNQQHVLRNQLALRPVALNQTAPQSVSIMDLPSPTSSSPLLLLDEINYSYYDQSFRDMKWSNEEINPVPSVVCEAFREDSSWYESNFEDPFDTVRCSPVACNTVSKVPSISSPASSSKLRPRLYKRHSYSLSSPSSLVDIQSYTEDKIDNFSMLLGPFVEAQPPIYPSEKVESMSSTSSIISEPVDTLFPSKQVGSSVAKTNHSDKNQMAVTYVKSKDSLISNMITTGLNFTNDALKTTMTSTNLWSAITTTTSSSSQTVSSSSHIGKNLPKSYQSESCLATEPNIESVWSFPGHLLVDIQPPQPATAVTSIVLTPQFLLTDSDQKSIPKSSIANATLTTTTAAPSLLSTLTCPTSHSYLSPRLPLTINTESGKVNTSSACSSAVNTPPSSTSPCSTSSLSLVDLSYLTHITECESNDLSNLNEKTLVSNDQKPLNINIENHEENSEILDSLYTCAESLPENTWKDIDMPALIRSPILTPCYYPDFLRDSQMTETPENYLTAIYSKLGSSFSAELFAHGNQKWPEQLVFDMRLLWQEHQLQCEKESFSKSDCMLATVVEPVDVESSPPDYSIINQLWCKNCGYDSNVEEELADPDEFLTKNNCFSQLWNINCQRRLAMSSQPIPHWRPHTNICSYSPQQLKYKPSTLFLPTVDSVDTMPLFSSNSPSKIASLPPISSFLHDNTSLFSPVSIFPSAAVISNNNNNSKELGNWDYFCCNYYSFYSSSPTGPFYHQQSWPSSSSSFFSSPLLSPPLSNSSFMFPLASYSRDFYPEKPVISLPVKVLPTIFVPQAIESAKHECPSLVDVKGDDNLPSFSGCDKMQDSSELSESDATTSLEDGKNFSEVQTSTLPPPSSSAVSIVTSPSMSSSIVSSTSPCLLSSSPSSLLQTSVMGPFQTSELIPSKRSAFKDVIPRKHTEMALETLGYDKDNRIKASEEEEELVQQPSPAISPHEMLYFSPRTHFRPIKTPPGVGIGHKLSLDALNAVAAADLLVTVGSNHAKSQRFIPENISTMAPVLYQPPDLFGGHPECQSLYQDFYQAVTIENKAESFHPKTGFVPKFRLHRNTDKYIQTGISHSSPLEEPPSKSTQFHLACQQPNEGFVDYDLEKLAEEVCSEDNIRDCTTASDVGPLPTGFESDCYMSLCAPQYAVSNVGGAFGKCERSTVNNAASIWSYDNQSESAGISSTPPSWGRDNIDSSTTSILGLMASDAKNHYPKTWSRGSDEIPNWTPAAVPEAINWTPVAPHDSWPIAVSSSTSSCSSAALDPGSCIHVFSQPSSIADGAHNTHGNAALNISGHMFTEEQLPNHQGNSKPVSVMSSHNSPISGKVPTFNTISSTNNLSKIPISNAVCSKSELWQQQQQNSWINSQKEHIWQPALPLTSEAVNPTMWDSNDGCGDTGVDHWMLESPGTEDSDWTSETPVHKTPGKLVWPKPEEVDIWPQSNVNKDSPLTSLLDKSWSVDDTHIDELDWYLSVTSAMKIRETKKALMDAVNSQQVWEGNLLRCPVSYGDNINSDVWFNKSLFCTPKLSTERKDWTESKDCTPETSLSASSYLTTDPLLAPLSVKTSSTWVAASEKPCYWPEKDTIWNMNEENLAKKWLSVQPHVMSYDKISNQGYHENMTCKPENTGDVKDIDIYKKNENDSNNDNNNKNKDCCKDVEVDNLSEELSTLNCKEILKKTGTEWLYEKSDHIDWTYARDMSVTLSWPAVPSQASISCSGDHCQEPLFGGCLNDYTLTSNNANFKANTVVNTGTEKVGPLNWAEPHCVQKFTEKSANSLTPVQTDKTLAVSSQKVTSSNVKKSCENLETLVPLPWEAVYSSELEKEWLNSETSLNSCNTAQLHQGKELNIKSWSLKKPCSFFLEGNCRRTECKFSHDISTITCRFWEDGECFKGDTCPFLHGYYATAATTASATISATDKYESAAVGSSSSEVASASTLKELSFLPQSNVTNSQASSQACV